MKVWNFAFQFSVWPTVALLGFLLLLVRFLLMLIHFLLVAPERGIEVILPVSTFKMWIRLKLSSALYKWMYLFWPNFVSMLCPLFADKLGSQSDFYVKNCSQRSKNSILLGDIWKYKILNKHYILWIISSKS